MSKVLKGKFQVASTDPATFSSTFDLLYEIHHNAERYTLPDSANPTWLSLYTLPRYVLWNLDRVLHGSGGSIEVAMAACTYYGVGRLFQSESFKNWQEVRDRALSAKYKSSADFSDVQGVLNSLRLTTNDKASGLKRRNFRCPETIRRQVFGAAKVVGMAGSVLAQVLLVDGLRMQTDVIDEDRDSMTVSVDELYGKLARQVVKLEWMLEGLGVGK